MAGLAKPQRLQQLDTQLSNLFATTPQDDLAAIRQAAQQQFVQYGLPSRKHEDWQFTNLDALAVLSTADAEPPPPIPQHLSAIDYPCLTIVNGHIYGNIPNNVASVTGTTSHWLDNDAAALLNASLLQSHCNLRCQQDSTLWIRYVHTQSAAAFSQIHLHLDEGVELQLIETHESCDAISSSNHQIHLSLAQGAKAHHVKWLRVPNTHQHFGQHVFDLQAHAELVSSSILQGASLIRNHSYTTLNNEYANSSVNSLYWGNDNQTIDTRTLTKHNAPNCESVQLHKGVLQDKANGVFQGKIFVDPIALKTDGQMDNKALLLSPTAQNNSKPQLEIYADDVKCSHGFTCGEMDKEQLFYMRARGFSMDVARGFLIHAFASEVTERIDHVALRHAIEDTLYV